jgi:hypothetical protein
MKIIYTATAKEVLKKTVVVRITSKSIFYYPIKVTRIR